MSQLLEILGKAIVIDTADLIWHWFDVAKLPATDDNSAQYQLLKKIVQLARTNHIKTDTAAEQLRLYLFENPSCPYGRLAAAAIYMQNNQLQEAIEELNSVYMRQPSNTIALYALGHCYERLGKEAQAIEFYQDCLKFKNYLQLPRQRLAAIYFKNGQLEKTISEYELLKREYPDDIPTLIALGHLYIVQNKFDLASDTFNTAILIHPDNFHSQDDQIDELIRNGQLQEAAEYLEDSLQTEPGRADLLAKYADVLSMLGATTEAVERYYQAIRLSPGFLEATIKLGTRLLQLNDEEHAAHQFNMATEINDQIVDAYIGLATARKLAGKSSEALDILSLASAIQPNSNLLFAQTAVLRFKAELTSSKPFSDQLDSPQMMEAIIAAHRQQITFHPQNPDLYYRIGLLMMGLGKLDKAIEAFQNALEINPTFSRARNKLTICLFETGQKDLAMDQLTHPDYIDTKTLELHYKTALLYCDKIKFASSLINLEQFMADNFTGADATVNISLILQNLGLLDRAAAMWDNLADTAAQAMNPNPS